MQLQNRSDKEETDQRLERASLQELRVRRTSPVPDARDAYNELRKTILQILSREIGRPHLQDGVAARAFIQAQLDDILLREKIILNRRERRQLNHDIMAAALTADEAQSYKESERPAAKVAPIESFLAAESAGSNADLLRAAVLNRKNILIGGKSRAGKTALLGALCNLISADDPIITIEQEAKLQFDHPRLVALHMQDPGIQQQGGISLHKLVVAAARTHTCRLILDSLQGAETYAWLHAVNAGQRGSMATCTALSAQDALARFEAMAHLAGPASTETIRSEIASAVDLIIYVERGPSGPPHITSLCKIAGVGKEQFKAVSLL